MFENELATLACKLTRGLGHGVEDPVYDLMSDAFVWSDEQIDFHALSQGEVGVMRCLWRYRTSLVTGIKDDRFKELWSRAIALVPDWVGFAESRNVYSADLAQRYYVLKGKGVSK